MVFCQIDEKLVEIVHRIANGKKVIDLGAGECLFEYTYRKHIPDARVMSVEPLAQQHYYINRTDIAPFIAQGMKFENMDLPIFIRPCHGHFVPPTLKAMEDSVSMALYISKPQNVEIDIPEEYTYEMLDEWKGKDGERIYIIRLYGEPYNPTNREFFMVKMPHWENPCRMEKVMRDNREWLVNSRGGGMPMEAYENCEMVKCD